MKKSFGLVSKLGILSLVASISFGCVSSKNKNYSYWYQDIPWTVSGSDQGLDPFYGMTEKEREKTAKKIMESESKDYVREQARGFIEQYKFARKVEEFAKDIRDNYLTLKVGDVPEDVLNEEKLIEDNNEIKLEEEYINSERRDTEKQIPKKRYIVVRPGGDGLEIVGQNPTHIGIKGRIKVNGSASLVFEPRTGIAVPGTKGWRIPLPAAELKYEIGDKSPSLSLGYHFNF